MKIPNGLALRIDAVTDGTDTVLTVRTLTRVGEGALTVGSVPMPVAAGIGTTTLLVPLTECHLESVEVQVAVSNALSGGNAVLVTLVQGTTNNSPRWFSLCGGWPTAANSIGWDASGHADWPAHPDCPYRLTVADPAAGADIVADLGRYSVVSLSQMAATFTASAAVATRTPGIIISGDGTDDVGARQSVTTAASGSTRYQWVDSGQAPGVPTGYGSTMMPRAGLDGALAVQTVTTNIDVGDQWSEIGIYFIGGLRLPDGV